MNYKLGRAWEWGYIEPLNVAYDVYCRWKLHKYGKVKIFLHVLMYIKHKTYLSWVSMSSNGHGSQCVLVAGEVHVRLSTLYCYPCTVQLEEGE